MTDPYEILEVPRDADAGTIKRAYRRKAQKAHPDRDQSTGSGDRFRALQIAYDVLSDPARRARYDETGETHEGPTIETQALAYVAGLLHAMLDVVVDVEHFALVVQMKKQCEDELRNVRIGMAKLRDLQGRRRRACGSRAHAWAPWWRPRSASSRMRSPSNSSAWRSCRWRSRSSTSTTIRPTS